MINLSLNVSGVMGNDFICCIIQCHLEHFHCHLLIWSAWLILPAFRETECKLEIVKLDSVPVILVWWRELVRGCTNMGSLRERSDNCRAGSWRVISTCPFTCPVDQTSDFTCRTLVIMLEPGMHFSCFYNIQKWMSGQFLTLMHFSSLYHTHN